MADNMTTRKASEEFNILLVDDDDTDRDYYSELLRSNEDYVCKQLVASSLREARHLINANDNIDCVLLDHKLRDGMSDEFLQEIKQRQDAPAVLVFTSYGSKEKALQLLRLGADDYLDKRSITRDMLSRCIRYGIERARGERLLQRFKAEQETNRMQSDFISILSHEFKNSIHVIGQSVSLIRKKMADQIGQIDQYLGNISSSASQMNHLLDQSAEFASFNPQKVKVDLQTNNLYIMLLRDIERYQTLYPDRQFHLAGMNEQAPDIMVDNALYRQVIDNVVSNAVKYSEPAKPVNFLMAIGQEYVSIRVQDYGCGIPKQDVKKVGQKFFRASNVGVIEGTGMGLYITRSMMELMQGKHMIESREGVGTVVTLSFKRV